MLIPSIDLQGGRVVQLVQGERLAWASDDLDAWVARFAPFPIVQVIDLDAALGTGSNHEIVAGLCRRRSCQVGGGIRSNAAAQKWIETGARRVIIGSMLFNETGVNVVAAADVAATVGADAVVAAVDCRGDRVTVSGWTRTVPVSPTDAMRQLEPFVGAFLATLVDGEGLLGGIDVDRAMALRRATARELIVAGGIRSRAEIDVLHEAHIDAVVGMAIYTGRIPLESAAP